MSKKATAKAKVAKAKVAKAKVAKAKVTKKASATAGGSKKGKASEASKVTPKKGERTKPVKKSKRPSAEVITDSPVAPAEVVVPLGAEGGGSSDETGKSKGKKKKRKGESSDANEPKRLKKKTLPTTGEIAERLKKPKKLSKKAAAAKRKLAKMAAARREREAAAEASGKLDARRIAAVKAAVAEAQADLDAKSSSGNAKKLKKSPLKKAVLNKYREMLLSKLEALVGDLRSMESQALHGSGQDSSANHMADFGSDAYEQEFTLGLIENDEQVVNQINAALVRIEQAQFGLCLECGEEIPPPRLEAIPWASFCIRCQEINERW